MWLAIDTVGRTELRVAVFDIALFEEHRNRRFCLVRREAPVGDGVRVQRPARGPFTLVFVCLCYQCIEDGLLRWRQKLTRDCRYSVIQTLRPQPVLGR